MPISTATQVAPSNLTFDELIAIYQNQIADIGGYITREHVEDSSTHIAPSQAIELERSKANGELNSPFHPLYEMTAHRFPREKKARLRELAQDNISYRGRLTGTWWRYANAMGSQGVREKRRELLSMCIVAYKREPDRIDLLAETYFAAKHYCDLTGQFTTTWMDKLSPALKVYHDKFEQWGVLRSGYPMPKWIAAWWARFHGRDNLNDAEGNPFISSPDWLAYYHALPFQPGHLVHASVDEPMKVAYIKSVRDLLEDRTTRTTPGRYLKKFYPHLTDAQIKVFANIHTQENTPIEVKFARSESECVRVVSEGPSESCMCNAYHDHHQDHRPWYRGHVHPAAVYGYDEDNPEWDTDTEILYFEIDGKVKSRVVCSKLTKACARIYGDADKLRPAIEKLGYTQSPYALKGCRIRRIEDDGGDGYIMAYVDAGIGSGGGYLHYRSSGDDHWVLTTDEGDSQTYVGYSNNGVTEGGDDEEETECVMCGNMYHDDDIGYIEGHGSVCVLCQAEHFVEARMGCYTETVHRDVAVYCESNDEYYHEDYLSDNDVAECEVSGNYYKIDDLRMTSPGWVHESRVVELDEEDDDGNSWAVMSDTIETCDGRRIHVDSAVRDVLTGEQHYDGDDDLIEMPRPDNMYGDTWSFAAESFADHTHRFYVVGNTLTITRPGAQPDRGAIPLVEYLMAFGSDDIGNMPGLPYELVDLIVYLNEMLHTEKEVANDYQLAA